MDQELVDSFESQPGAVRPLSVRRRRQSLVIASAAVCTCVATAVLSHGGMGTPQSLALDRYEDWAEAMIRWEERRVDCHDSGGGADCWSEAAPKVLDPAAPPVSSRASILFVDEENAEVRFVPRCDAQRSGSILVYRSPRSGLDSFPSGAEWIGEHWYSTPGCESTGEGF